jgi:hypothetical protein
MSSQALQPIREAILDHRYALTEHAYDEMNKDRLDVLDVEAAILTGKLESTQSNDPLAGQGMSCWGVQAIRAPPLV